MARDKKRGKRTRSVASGEVDGHGVNGEVGAGQSVAEHLHIDERSATAGERYIESKSTVRLEATRARCEMRDVSACGVRHVGVRCVVCSVCWCVARVVGVARALGVAGAGGEERMTRGWDEE